MAKRLVKRMHFTTRTWAIEAARPDLKYMNRDGHLATYRSRREARRALRALKDNTVLPPPARAVRVSVTVTTIGRG